MSKAGSAKEVRAYRKNHPLEKKPQLVESMGNPGVGAKSSARWLATLPPPTKPKLAYGHFQTTSGDEKRGAASVREIQHHRAHEATLAKVPKGFERRKGVSASGGVTKITQKTKQPHKKTQGTFG